MPCKILAVHGYGFISEHDLGVQSRMVCEKVLKIHKCFDHIIFLGGWHDRKLSECLTSGKLMKKWLVWAGVTERKLYTVQDIFLPYAYSMSPPTNTAGEVDDLRTIINLNYFGKFSQGDIYAVGLCGIFPESSCCMV